MRMKDLHISSKNKSSYFIRVSKSDMMFVEVLPFLTQSQVETGFSSSWFSQTYLQELVTLLRSHLTEFSELYLPKLKDGNMKDSAKNKGDSKNFMLSGDHLRAACNFKTNTEMNYYVIPAKKANTVNTSENRFQEITMLQEKLMIYVCPKSSSSVLQLSQLLTCEKDNVQEDNEDISKYFQPISSKGSTK